MSALTRRIRNASRSARTSQFVESLEGRLLMAATPQANYVNFNSAAGMSLNGDTSVIGGKLILSGDTSEANSDFFNNNPAIDRFTTEFVIGNQFATSHGSLSTFTLHRDSSSAIGGGGASAGYANGAITANSVALVFNGTGDGTNSTFAFASGAATPFAYVTMPGINFRSGHSFTVDASYNGRVLSVSVVDQSDTTKIFSTSETIDLQTILGGSYAYPGFTSSTTGSGAGSDSSTINSWVFTGESAPIFNTVASSVLGSDTKTATLTSAANINAQSGIAYSWSTRKKPSGAGDAIFDTGTSANTGAVFDKAGTYQLRVMATSDEGVVTTSDVSVRIEAVATEIKITPHATQIRAGKHASFAASVYDQFGRKMSTQPRIKYYVSTGSGKINALTGFFTATKPAGHLVITAKTGVLSGTSGNTIVI